MAISFKGAHFPPEIMLMGVRWYLAYPLSTRHVEELMLERGVHVDHSTVNRWVIKYRPQLEEAFHRRKRPGWVSWRMDETSIGIVELAVLWVNRLAWHDPDYASKKRFTISTGSRVLAVTALEILPSMSRLKPVRPRDPRMMASQARLVAVSRIASAILP